MKVPEGVEEGGSPEGVQRNLAVEFPCGNVPEVGLAPLVLVGEKFLGAEPQGVAVELDLQFGTVTFQVPRGIDSAFPVHVAVRCKVWARRGFRGLLAAGNFP